MDTRPVYDYLKWWNGAPAGQLAAMVARLDKRSSKPGQGTADDLDRVSLAFIEHKQSLPICPDLLLTQAVLRLTFGRSGDVVFRTFEVGQTRRPALMLFIDGLAKRENLMSIIENLVIRLREAELPTGTGELFTFVQQRGVVSEEASKVTSISQVGDAILAGDAVVLMDGMAVGVRLSTPGWEHRKPEEPMAEPVVRGPKVGFTEWISTNLALVRRRLQDERLRVETMRIGTRSGTVVMIVYMVGLTLPELVQEVRSRLDRIKIDSILESGYIEELISDTTLTPFPLVKTTERPDVVAAEILEGKVGILVDGTPHALVVPGTFTAGMQAAEDYYQRWPMASFTRILRFVYLMIALLGPSIYIALLTYHHEMVPTYLLLSIMAAREGVPFPAVVEALLMEISFEVLREAGVRLPRTVGQAVSIVGALVIGEAAVRAGFVSPAMVIVVAITGISSFVIPLYSSALAIRMLRFPMMILAATFGFLGIVFGLLALSVHLASLRSFGVPYMSPTMPPNIQGMKDMMIRVPWWMMRNRPQETSARNGRRLGAKQSPGTDRYRGV